MDDDPHGWLTDVPREGPAPDDAAILRQSLKQPECFEVLVRRHAGPIGRGHAGRDTRTDTGAGVPGTGTAGPGATPAGCAGTTPPNAAPRPRGRPVVAKLTIEYYDYGVLVEIKVP